VILYVKTLKTDIYCFCLWCRNVFHVTLTEIFSISHLWRSQYHSVGWYNVLTISLCEITVSVSWLIQCTDNITLWDQRKNVRITDKIEILLSLNITNLNL
jgi:hypothetical protein